MRKLSFLILLIFISVGCSSELRTKMMPNEIEVMVVEEVGEEFYLPKYEGLDISYVYAEYFRDGELRSIDIQYSSNISNQIVKFYQNSKNVKEWEVRHNAKKIYGPFEGEVALFLSFTKGKVNIPQNNEVNITSNNGLKVSPLPSDNEVVNIDGIKVLINESNGFTAHSFSLEESYTLAYNTEEHFTQEEALEHTRSFIENVR